MRYAVLLLLFVQLTSAAELKLTGELHYDSLLVTLQNTADREVSFALKFDLKQKTGDGWKSLSSLDCSVNSSVGPLGSKELNCSYTTPAEPGQYKIYARASIVNSTYTYKDFLFTVGEAGFKEPEPKSDVVLRLVSAPEKVKTGEEFFVVVNVTANKEADLEVYSYVYSGKTCYSLNGWKGNAVKYEFKEGESRLFNLSDSVIHDAANGTYSLKVRARGSKDYDLAGPVEVEQTPVDLLKEIPKTNTVRNASGESLFSIQFLLPLLGSIPLAILLIKRVL